MKLGSLIVESRPGKNETKQQILIALDFLQLVTKYK